MAVCVMVSTCRQAAACTAPWLWNGIPTPAPPSDSTAAVRLALSSTLGEGSPAVASMSERGARPSSNPGSVPAPPCSVMSLANRATVVSLKSRPDCLCPAARRTRACAPPCALRNTVFAHIPECAGDAHGGDDVDAMTKGSDSRASSGRPCAPLLPAPCVLLSSAVVPRTSSVHWRMLQPLNPAAPTAASTAASVAHPRSPTLPWSASALA